MSDDKTNQEEKVEEKNPSVNSEQEGNQETQIQERPEQLADGLKDEVVGEDATTDSEQEEKEPELSPEEEKKIAEEVAQKESQEALEKVREEMRPGDLVKVYTKIKEGDKERIQAFQGIIISKKGRGISKTFIVRKIAVGGIGVERIWPLYSPTIVRIDIVQEGNSRRAKLYYMRERIGKAAMAVKKKK